MNISSGQSSFANISMDKIEQYIELKDVYSNPVFYKFYEVLCDSMVLIDWLREETRGMDNIAYNRSVCIDGNRKFGNFGNKYKVIVGLSDCVNFSIMIIFIETSRFWIIS